MKPIKIGPLRVTANLPEDKIQVCDFHCSAMEMTITCHNAGPQCNCRKINTRVNCEYRIGRHNPNDEHAIHIRTKIGIR